MYYKKISSLIFFPPELIKLHFLKLRRIFVEGGGRSFVVFHEKMDETALQQQCIPAAASAAVGLNKTKFLRKIYYIIYICTVVVYFFFWLEEAQWCETFMV